MTTPALAIALQVWDGDVHIAKRLVKLICSIEPEKRDDIEFILSVRRGTNPFAAQDILESARTKFTSVQLITCKRYGDGWPNGSNDLWSETMTRIAQMRDSGRIKSDGVLTFEADCIPLRPNWLTLLALEWNCRPPGKLVVGHVHSFSDGLGGMSDPNHINGNAIFHCNLLRQHPEMCGSDSTRGWDDYHGALLLKIGVDTNLIYQKYRIQKITREEVEAIRKNGFVPALFHGIKGTSGIEAIESMVSDGSFFTRNCNKELFSSIVLKETIKSEA